METNNKLREALSDACYAMFNFLKTQNGGYEEMANALDKAKAALAEPMRNCDVGTVGEQDERFYAFCHRYYNEKGLCDKACPCHDFNMIGGACSIVWGLLPYVEKEGGAR